VRRCVVFRSENALTRHGNRQAQEISLRFSFGLKRNFLVRVAKVVLGTWDASFGTWNFPASADHNPIFVEQGSFFIVQGLSYKI